MSQSNIITSQFVKIDQSPAGIGNRILARIIDSIVQTIYIISMLFLFRFLISSSTIGNIIEFIVFFCPIAFYSFLCETFNNGQSLGKYIMKIRVVKKDGTTILAKVNKVGTKEIEFKKWKNRNGPTYTISVEDVLSINYQNGEKDLFDSSLSNAPTQKSSNNNSPKIIQEYKEKSIC